MLIGTRRNLSMDEMMLPAARRQNGILRHKDPMLVPCAAQTYSLTDSRSQSKHCLVMFRFQVSNLRVLYLQHVPCLNVLEEAVQVARMMLLSRKGMHSSQKTNKQVMHLIKVRPIRHFLFP